MLTGIIDRMGEAVYMNTDIDFSIEMFFKEFIVDYSDTKPVYVNGLKYFNNQAQEFLGDEWK